MRFIMLSLFLCLANPANASDPTAQDEADLQKATEQCLLEKPEDGTLYCLEASVSAALLYADACDAGNYDACVKYAVNMVTTNETQGDFEPIGLMLETGCNALHGLSCAYLGSMFGSGWRGNGVMDLGPGLEKNMKNARFFSGKGCTLDSGLGCYDMGVFSYNGDGAERNGADALRYFSKACNLGYGEEACANRDLVQGEMAGQ
jgi:TPR repeat protein